MKPWIERIAEARERGAFTDQDRDDSISPFKCAVAEASQNRYVDFINHPIYAKFREDHPGMETALGGAFPGAVWANDFDAAEKALHQAHDVALQIKREAP